jgi:hypothetical protein
MWHTNTISHSTISHLRINPLPHSLHSPWNRSSFYQAFMYHHQKPNAHNYTCKSFASVLHYTNDNNILRTPWECTIQILYSRLTLPNYQLWYRALIELAACEEKKKKPIENEEKKKNKDTIIRVTLYIYIKIWYDLIVVTHYICAYSTNKNHIYSKSKLWRVKSSNSDLMDQLDNKSKLDTNLLKQYSRDVIKLSRVEFEDLKTGSFMSWA